MELGINQKVGGTEMQETRKVNITFAKNGAGRASAKIILPAPWVKELNINKIEREATIKLDENKIIIKKYDAEDEKDILLTEAKKLLESLELRSVQGNRRKTKKSRIDDILTRLYQLNENIDFVNDYKFVEKVKKYERTETTKRKVVVVYKTNCKFE